MLGLRRRTATAPAPAPVIPFPTARHILRSVGTAKQQTYEEVAESIGFAPSELIVTQIANFLEEEGIQRYDWGEVDRWLKSKLKEMNAETWCWRPLRTRDRITEYRWGRVDWINGEHRWSGGFYRNDYCPVYDRLVPAHALQKVAKIDTRFGEQTKIFVSDFYDGRNIDPDPFIMVRPAVHSYDVLASTFIFDVWDEPGFGL
jgi:hypothetical protein